MKVYLIRHGQSKANEKFIMQGSLDAPLSERGEKQAKKLKYKLPPFSAVYSSSLKRAIQTAKLATGKDPIEFDELQELHLGELEGTKLDNSIRNSPEMSDYFALVNDRVRKTKDLESHESFIARITRGFKEIVDIHKNKSDVIAIFIHGGTMRGLLQNHLGLLNGADTRFLNTESVVLNYASKFTILERIKNEI